jgi:hypothetical protein
VSGNREDVPTEYDDFACLYPDEPHFRGYTRLALATGAEKRRIVQAVTALRVPDDVERDHRASMRRVAPMEPHVAWHVALLMATSRGLPIGCYAMGRTTVGNQPRGLLWVMATVSPTTFTTRLQAAAQE